MAGHSLRSSTRRSGSCRTSSEAEWGTAGRIFSSASGRAQRPAERSGRRTIMTKIETLIQELEQEATVTRRVLERAPEDRLTWKPHEKSMTLGQLALHVAMIPGGLAQASRNSPFQIPGFQHPTVTSRAELISA